jgi:predicted anti-sigma-YlaC factor YlaD
MIGARLDTDDRDTYDRTARPVDPLDVKEAQADVRAAYERGRADERASRRRHPILMTLTFVAAICGVALIALAAANGSFSRGGTVADENLQAAVTKAEPQVRDAASQAGQSLRDAGQAAKAKASGSPN